MKMFRPKFIKEQKKRHPDCRGRRTKYVRAPRGSRTGEIGGGIGRIFRVIAARVLHVDLNALQGARCPSPNDPYPKISNIIFFYAIIVTRKTNNYDQYYSVC